MKINNSYTFSTESQINNRFKIIANTTGNPPKIPSNPNPPDGSTDVSINTALGRMRYALINMRKIMEEKKINLTID